MVDIQDDKSLESYNAEQESDDDIVATVRKNIRKFRTHYSRWRIQAKLDYDFYAGNQWTSDEITTLEEQGRPPIVFNRIARTINCVTGLELQNRQEINCVPFGTEDNGLSDLANSAVKFVRNETDAEDEESESYEDVLICGLGGIYTYVDYEVDQDGKICEERIDPFMLAFDPASKKKNVEDARWKAIARKYTKDEFYETWPDADIGKEGGTLFDEADSSFSNQHDDYDTDDVMTRNSDTKGLIEVVYYQCYTLVPIYRVADIATDPMTGQQHEQIKELSEDDFNSIKDQIEASGLKYVKQNKRQYHQYIIAGGELLEKSDAPIEGFSIEILTGLRDRNTNIWFGLCRLMRDPQRWANKWLSQIMHIINSNAKGGYLYETGSFKDPQQAEKDMARPDKNVEVNPNKLGNIIPKPQATIPSDLNNLLQYAMQAINDTSGVSLELQGLVGHEQTGIVENSRKNAGVTVLAQFTNTLRKFRKAQGRTLISFIQNYISDGRLIRIDEKNGPKYVPLLKDKMATKYDIMIDDAPTSTNMKEKVFASMMQIMPLALQAGIPIPPEVLDYSPLPQVLIDDWKQFIENNHNDPVKQQTTQLTLDDKAADIEKKRADAKLADAKAIEIGGGQQTDPTEKILDAHIEGIKQQSTKIKAFAEVGKAHASTQQAKINLVSSLAKLQHAQQQPQHVNQP